MTASPASLVKREVRSRFAFLDRQVVLLSSRRWRRPRLPRRRPRRRAVRLTVEQARAYRGCRASATGSSSSTRSRSSTSPAARRSSSARASRAVELVEAGEADVVVVAYFDRLVRIARRAGRDRRAGREGRRRDPRRRRRRRSRTARAGQWLSGDDARRGRRVPPPRDRRADRRTRSVAPSRAASPRSRTCRPATAPDDGRLEPHPTRRRVVAEAFRLRAAARPSCEVREYLREHGIERVFHGDAALLALADRARRASLRRPRQPDRTRRSSTRDLAGRPAGALAARPRAKSERLLARLGVLRCGTCGARMVVGTANHADTRCTVPTVERCKAW